MNSASLQFSEQNTFSIYIHYPFCERKCPYCSFVSYGEQDIETQSVKESFSNLLNREIEIGLNQARANGLKCGSIYIGGGTPSLIHSNDVKRALDAISSNCDLDQSCEITLEANPSSLSISKAEKLIAVGVNRVSIGLQSFKDEKLRLLERVHDVEAGLKSFESARKAGFDNISLDLIFGLAGETIGSWKEELQYLISLKPEHVSLYELTIEAGTKFEARKNGGEDLVVSEDTRAELYELTIDTLCGVGYRHYEVSNFSFPGYESRHNMGYWIGRPYLGFGPGAHSYWSDQKGRTHRWSNTGDLANYVECVEAGKQPISDQEELSENEKLEEHIMLGLRTDRGVDYHELSRQLSLKQQQTFKSTCDRLVSEDFLKLDQGHLCVTRKGLLGLDEIVSEICAAI